MSGTPGLTEKCRPMVSVLSGRNQNVSMGRVALGWCWKVDKFQEGAILDKACKVLLGWPFCSQFVRTTQRGNHPMKHPMKVAFPGL